MKTRSNNSVPVYAKSKPASWQRKLERQLHDPNRLYDGRPVDSGEISIKAVRLG